MNVTVDGFGAAPHSLQQDSDDEEIEDALRASMLSGRATEVLRITEIGATNDQSPDQMKQMQKSMMSPVHKS